MTKLLTISFRANVPNGTAATVPVNLDLDPISNVLHKLTIFATSTPDLSKSGFRVRNHGTIILPGSGSNETGFTFGASEAGWSPLASSPMDVFLSGYALDGPPFRLSLEFYNTAGAALLVGGFVHLREPEFDLVDLIKEIRAWQKKDVPPVRYDEHIVQTPASRVPPFPTQQVKGK